MRFFADDLSVKIPVEWFYVPEDRSHVPYGHPFGSRNWDDQVGPPLLGEVPGSARYYAGDHADELLGIGLCGTKQQWENGPSLLDKPRPLNPLTGRQCCCGRGVVSQDPGLVVGSESELVVYPSTDACTVYPTSPLRWQCTDYDWTLQETPFWFSIPSNPILDHASLCAYQGFFGNNLAGSFRMFLTYSFPSPGRMNLTMGANLSQWSSYFVYLALSAWNPFGPNVLTKVYDTGFSAVPLPATVTMIPSP